MKIGVKTLFSAHTKRESNNYLITLHILFYEFTQKEFALFKSNVITYFKAICYFAVFAAECATT